MTDGGSPGRAFSGGFFGCFGVLGAVVLCLLLLVMCGSLGQRREARDSDAALTAGADPQLVSNSCVLAVLKARETLAGFDRFTARDATAPVDLGGGKFRCDLAADGSAFVLEAHRTCERAGDAGCVVVDRGTLDGVQLLEMRRR